jgi:hypothetical protein
LRGDFYNCDKCFGIISWDGYTTQKEVGEAYPDRADKKFYPKIGEEFYFFKWCGAVRGDIWTGHRFQHRLVRRGMAPFRTVAEAEAAFEKKEWDETIS